jgi:hypothetical protein
VDRVIPLNVYPDELITGAEAAALAGVSEAAIRQWATRGKIQRFPGRRRSEGTLYAEPEVRAEIAKRAESAVLAA